MCESVPVPGKRCGASDLVACQSPDAAGNGPAASSAYASAPIATFRNESSSVVVEFRESLHGFPMRRGETRRGRSGRTHSRRDLSPPLIHSRLAANAPIHPHAPMSHICGGRISHARSVRRPPKQPFTLSPPPVFRRTRSASSSTPLCAIPGNKIEPLTNRGPVRRLTLSYIKA